MDEATVELAETVSGSPVIEPVIPMFRAYQIQPAAEVTATVPAARLALIAATIAMQAIVTGTKNAFVRSPARSNRPRTPASRFDRESRNRDNARNIAAASGTTSASFDTRATSG